MNNHIGTKIKELREKRQMTQTELAQKINVSKSVISAYEKGIRTPSFKVIKDLSIAFDVPESYLLIRDDNTGAVLIDITDLTLSQQRIIYALLTEFKESNAEHESKEV